LNDVIFGYLRAGEVENKSRYKLLIKNSITTNSCSPGNHCNIIS
jgi:hypothetical protein